jgi:hypothetical protein
MRREHSEKLSSGQFCKGILGNERGREEIRGTSQYAVASTSLQSCGLTHLGKPVGSPRDLIILVIDSAITVAARGALPRHAPGVHRGSGRATLRGPASRLLSRPRRRRTASTADRSPAGHAHMRQHFHRLGARARPRASRRRKSKAVAGRQGRKVVDRSADPVRFRIGFVDPQSTGTSCEIIDYTRA